MSPASTSITPRPAGMSEPTGTHVGNALVSRRPRRMPCPTVSTTAPSRSPALKVSAIAGGAPKPPSETSEGPPKTPGQWNGGSSMSSWVQRVEP